MIEFHARYAMPMEPQEEPGDAGVPPAMADGPGRWEGTVRWKLCPSRVTEGAISALEERAGHRLPAPFRAYLQTWEHLFDQLWAPAHDLVFWTPMPADDPLEPLSRRILGWEALLRAGLVPFAEWGDCHGPMCFDVAGADPREDCPVVWIDHEVLHSMGESRAGDRAALVPHLRPLYASSEQMLRDLFSVPVEE